MLIDGSQDSLLLGDDAFRVFLQRYTLPVGAENPMVAEALRERAGRTFNAVVNWHFWFLGWLDEVCSMVQEPWYMNDLQFT